MFQLKWRSFSVGSFCLLATIATAGAATLNPVKLDAYFKASNPDPGDAFGTAVAISGDLIAISAIQEAGGSSGVGGNQEDDTASGAGAVYVFRRDSGSWTQEAYVKAVNPDIGDNFGVSVALSGDTLVVGAPFEDSYPKASPDPINNNLQPESGAAYVYVRSGGTWVFQQMLKGGNGALFSRGFGYSVAIDGDLLVVGDREERNIGVGINPPYQTSFGNLSGAAYVFRRSGGLWTEIAYIKSPYFSEDGSYKFGEKVAVSGSNVFVSAIRDASAARGMNGDMTQDPFKSVSGAVFAYRLGPSGLTFDAYIKSSNSDPGDAFGWEIAASGDTLAVSAIGEDSGSVGLNGDQGNSPSRNESGAVYLFERGGNGWNQTAYLKAPATGASDQFGKALAFDGKTLAVTSSSKSPGPEGNSTTAGAVYLYQHENSGWDFYSIAKPPKSYPLGGFGLDIAVSQGTLVAGAATDGSSGSGIHPPAGPGRGNSGAAYVFSGFAGSGASPIIIQSVSLQGANIILEFTADPALTQWKVFGGNTPLSLPQDLTATALITEPSAGHYRATLPQPLPISDTFFLKVSR